MFDLRKYYDFNTKTLLRYEFISENIRKSILIICLLLVGSAIYAQNSSKITIKRKNISLQEALAEVRKLTHMSISYNDSQLPVNRISLDIEKQPLEQALKVILKGTGFTYLIKDNYIMIVPEQNIKRLKAEIYPAML